MIGVSTTSFNLSMLRKFNVWYTVKDGNWDDPTIWRSNGVKKHALPQPGDDVHLDHTVAWNYNFPVNTYNNVIKDLYVSGKLVCNSSLNQTSLTITGNLQCSGTLDLSGSNGGGGFGINIGGVNNFIANPIMGTNSTINYYSTYNFTIPDINYNGLAINGIGSTKTISNNLSVSGALNIGSSATFELGNFDATIGNLYSAGLTASSPILSKTGPGTVNLTGSTHYIYGTVSFTGNPTVNISGSFAAGLGGSLNLGAGTINILQNSSWSLSSSGNNPYSMGTGTFLIAAGKTLTLSGVAPWLNNGTVNGANSSSTLNVSTSYAFGNSNTVMATGVFNHNFSGTSTIVVQSATTFTLPISSFYNLTINGITILGANTTVSNNLTTTASFQLSGYNFTVNGTTNYAGGTIYASGAGNITFNTLIAGFNGGIDFSAGNPTVNLTGNASGDVRAGLSFGSAPVNITQSITIGWWTGGNVAPGLNTSFLIASGKTLTNVGLSTTTGGINTTGTINGADSTSVFDNRSVVNYFNATAPMVTGKLYCNQAANTFTYSLAGNQDIQVPSDPSTPGYKNLTLNGSGAKKLLGNVSVKGTYTLTSPATLNSNGFALTNP